MTLAMLMSTAQALHAGDGVCVNEALTAFDDWPAALAEFELHGLAPLVFDAVQRHELQLIAAQRAPLQALHLRHRAATEARYQVMQGLCSEFARAAIPLVALKGVVLAPMLYDHDYLRPMRDIDVLVPCESLGAAAALLRDAGFELPAEQPSKFMRSSHQLPNATKSVDGFTISVELHHDALGSDVPGHLRYPEVAGELQQVIWRGLQLSALNHELMLHQLCRHLAGLHPSDVIKLINMLDVVMYAERYRDEIDWHTVATKYLHVLNTLKCLHYVIPLSADVLQLVGGAPPPTMAGVGRIMPALSRIFGGGYTWSQRSRSLFSPSDWWLHIYYNVDPAASLLGVKLLRHPANVIGWLSKRFYSAVRGG